MKLVTFSEGRGEPRLGAVLGPWDAWEHIIDLHAVNKRLPADALEFLDAAGTLTGAAWRLAEESLRRAARAVARSRPAYAHDPRRVHLHPPLRPRLLRDFIAFRGHIARTRAARGEKVPAEWDRVPAYYNGDHLNLVGPGDLVSFPRVASFQSGVWKHPLSQKLDYELEIGYVVAAKQGVSRTVPQLFGVTIFNDFSMRDLQSLAGRVGMGPAPGKDWANALGPCVVTRDEFGPLRAQKVAVRVNGVQRLAGRLRNLVTHNPLLEPGERTAWSFAEIATFLASTQPVHTGELWGSGTIPGGCEFEKGEAAAYLVPGDAVELEVEGIGTLANRIAKPA